MLLLVNIVSVPFSRKYARLALFVTMESVYLISVRKKLHDYELV